MKNCESFYKIFKMVPEVFAVLSLLVVYTVTIAPLCGDLCTSPNLMLNI